MPAHHWRPGSLTRRFAGGIYWRVSFSSNGLSGGSPRTVGRARPRSRFEAPFGVTMRSEVPPGAVATASAPGHGR